MKFENILAEVQGFGKFQLRLLLLLVIPRVTLPFQYLLNNYIGYIPAHHCDISSLDDGGDFGNLSQAEKLIVSIPVQEDGTRSSCQMFAEPQYHLLLNSTNATGLVTVPCQNGWVHDNTTFKSTLTTEWDLVCDKKRMVKTTATIFFMGVMFGSAVFGYLSDRFGRKRALLLSFLTATFFGFTCAFSYNFAMFAVMRFFTGVGMSGISIITVVLCIEWVDIEHRAAVGILLSFDWSFCATLLPVIAYFVNDWRHLSATTTAPLLLAIACWRWIPESARWLISNGKVKSAHFYLSKCAKVNGRERAMAELTPEVLSKVILVENENRTYSYLDLVRTPRMRRLVLFTTIMWFSVACTYYGISLNNSDFGVNIYLTQLIYGLIELPAKAIVYFNLKKIGRRSNQTLTFALIGLCMFCSIFVPQDKGYRTATGALGKMFAEAAFTNIYLYTTELYPTVMRQNGLGFCSLLARIGVAVSPLILMLEEVWGRLPNIIFTLVTIAGGLSTLFLPETRNIRLPETIEEVEQTGGRSVFRASKSTP